MTSAVGEATECDRIEYYILFCTHYMMRQHTFYLHFLFEIFFHNLMCVCLCVHERQAEI